MRILLDHCTPATLRAELTGHDVDTAQERGWNTLSNGALLEAAEQGAYDLLVTTDRDFRSRPELASSTVAVLLLVPNRWRNIERNAEEVRSAVSAIQPGAFVELNCW